MKLSLKQFFIYSLQFFLINCFDFKKRIVQTCTEDVTLIKEIGEYFKKFASFSYCTIKTVEKQECCYVEGSPKNLPNKKGHTINDWTLVEHNTSKEYNPDFKNDQNIFSIFKSDKYNKTIISFTGTQNFNQLLFEELISIESQSMNCYDHKGFDVCLGIYFEKRMDAIYNRIKEIIYENKTGIEKNYQVIVIGHSLGGASAEIILYKLAKDHYIERYKHFPIVITYGQPKTGNKPFSTLIQQVTEAKFKFVNEGDPIPMLPLVSIYIKKNEGKEIYLLRERFYDHYQTFIIKKDGSIEIDNNYSPLSFREEETKLIETAENLYDIIEEDFKQQINELMFLKNDLKIINKEETLSFKGEERYEASLKKIEKKFSLLYITEILSIIRSELTNILNSSFEVLDIFDYHTIYLKIKIGEYCSGNNYISLKYLFIISFLFFIL